MSRIFDALQRSGLEQTGVEYPDVVAIATGVFEAPQSKTAEGDASPESSPKFPPSDTPILEASAQKQEDLASPGLHSLDVHVPPSSRLVYFTEPDSLAAEKFRFLGVRLRQLRQNRSLKKVLVTSTIPEEGKSLVSANLAGVLARRKERVLLIEGDLRRPSLTERFGLRNLTGLADSLQNSQQ